MDRTPSSDELERRGPQTNKERSAGILNVSVLSDKEDARGSRGRVGRRWRGSMRGASFPNRYIQSRERIFRAQSPQSVSITYTAEAANKVVNPLLNTSRDPPIYL